ncbi:MAG: baseplate J/gp47 family protein [bacterium]
MDEVLYLEPDEEITSVVDKLKGLEAKSVGLVAPKGSSIVQSLVSLKLLQKQAKQLDKKIAIITSDEVGQNLASRIDLPVYKDVRSQSPIQPINQKEPEDTGPIEITDSSDIQEEMKEGPDEGTVGVPTENVGKEKTPPKEVDEEYKDLPKSFEVHRYDEKDTEDVMEETKKEPVAAPIEAVGGRNANLNQKEPAPQAPAAQKNAGFVNKPIVDKKPDNRMELESARPIAREGRSAMPSKGKKSKKKTIIIVGVSVLVFLALVFAELAYARLEINLKIPAEEISKDVTITVEKNHPAVDLTGSVIGGVQLDKEIPTDGTYSASGEREVGNKATGTLTLRNDAGVNEVISSGSTVRSTSGVEFTTNKEVTVPKATATLTVDDEPSKVLGEVTVTVTAVEPGSSSNLSPNTSYVISGKSKILISGGTSGGTTRKVKVVTSADVSAAKEALEKKAIDKFKTDLKTDKKTLFVEDAIKTDTVEFTTTKNVNEDANEFKASAKVKTTTITFLKKDFDEVVVKAAEKDLPEGKSLLVTDSDSITPRLEDNQINIGKLKIKGELRSHLGPAIDLDQLVSSFRLKPIKSIKSRLEGIEGVEINDVNLSPNFALPVGPILKNRTHIKIEYTKK